MSANFKKRILFVENRGKTFFWEKVSIELLSRGFEVHFLVQNPFYAPKQSRHVHVLKLPNKKDIKTFRGQEPLELKEYLISRDRGFKFFKSGNEHYGYYYVNIKDLIDKISPDLVVGECTLFHELITIFLCKERSINFIHPTGTRYPPGRFQIFSSDKQITTVSSGEKWRKEKLNAFISDINSGHIRPEYMQKKSSFYDICKFKFYKFFSLITVALSHQYGERFNTPSFTQKLKLNINLKKQIKEWKKVSGLPNTSKNILYLMQMQPEANLDVWGSAFSDQVSIVKKLASILPNDFNVIVKINPKAKYELLGFLNQIKNYANVYFAPINSSMNDLHDKTYGILTVTGTIGLESVFSSKNCISLAHPILASNFPQYSANTIDSAVIKLMNFNDRISHGEELLSLLVENSFSGTIGEPLYSRNALNKENIKKVADAIIKCL